MKLKEAVIILSVCIIIVLALEIFTPINLIGRVIGVVDTNLPWHNSGQIDFSGGLEMKNEAPILIAEATNGVSGFRINVKGGNNQLLRIQNNGEDKFTILPTGNVGIGTTSPGAKLDIIQSGTDPAIMVSGGTNPWIKVSDGVTITKLQTISGAGVVGTDTPSNFQIRTGNELRMIFDANGKVGIGTPTPAEKLDVAGTVKATLFKGNLEGTANYATSAVSATNADNGPQGSWCGHRFYQKSSGQVTSTSTCKGTTLPSCPSGYTLATMDFSDNDRLQTCIKT